MGKRFLMAGSYFLLCVLLSCARTDLARDGHETAYVYNRVDELLAGDIDDTVSLAGVERHLKDDSVGLGTTSRPDNGEVVILGKGIFWVDPERAGVHELTAPGEMLPFCAVADVPPAAMKFALSEGDLKEQVLTRCRETGEGLLAVKVDGAFETVKVSVAKSIPREGFDFDHPGDYLAFFTEGEGSWEMVGFYAASSEDQRIFSVEGHPLHVHGMNTDRSFGGHVQKAALKSGTLFVEPITRIELENR